MSVIVTKNITKNQYPVRNKSVVDLVITDKPERKVNTIHNNRERDKLIKTCEKKIRESEEYRDYVSQIKNSMDMKRCAVLSNIVNGNGKRYSIELHHEPFTLYDIVDLEILRREDTGETLSTLDIAEYVTSLHYDGIVGLIPLSKTQHELIDSHKVFIPLQHIYQDYHKLYEMYEEYLDTTAEHIRKKIEMKVHLSMLCEDIQSDCAEAEFKYINVEGFDFPKIDESWLTILSKDRGVIAKEEEAIEKEKKKLKKSSS